MDGVSSSDVIMPTADLVRMRLASAISIKQEIATGSYSDVVVNIARAMITALRSGHKIIFFGNGGSAQDAGHLAAEFMGRFAFDRPGLFAMSLPDATAAMTAIGNDYSYAEVYARQVFAAGRPGDVAVGLTTFGKFGKCGAGAGGRCAGRDDNCRHDRRGRGQGRRSCRDVPAGANYRYRPSARGVHAPWPYYLRDG